ncbi:MAG: serine--tRNA ligase [Candidatus Fermentithermobacillus carboniphilus]|uniref:Serine--tRNA ligase n=1 Tax=Candidatus Fermentithermobacillus carboniphilus TaxID=3085328 RepID=A0AAT9LB32_9FIRM|nr:MAG: serine--tRNA ligase [Candidatus Fermentithermobacillus carboniphilus]
MLDLKFIREHPELVQKALSDRNYEFDLSRVLILDEEVRKLKGETEGLRAKRNEIAAKVAEAKRKGLDSSEDMAVGAQVAENISRLESTLAEKERQLHELLTIIPNIPHQSVPVGPDESHNVELKRWGEVRKFDFEPVPHWDLGPRLGILDLERAAKMAGSRFPLLKGEGARLERALINFMLDVHVKRQGYTEIFPPFLVNERSMFGTGQLPKFKGDMFKIENLDLFLIPTAEVPVTNVHREEILHKEALPIKYVAYSACFRLEAGSTGKDTRGVIRNHQFNKVELVHFTLPEKSYDALEELTRDAEEILELLELPYRRVLLCTGDMGFASAKTYDLEVWLPSYNGYKEISSCSNFEDFQARRAGIRFKRDPKSRPEYVHTLNGSGLAVGRTWAAILENYQNRDGSVTIPPALRPYMDGMTVMGK